MPEALVPPQLATDALVRSVNADLPFEEFDYCPGASKFLRFSPSWHKLPACGHCFWVYKLEACATGYFFFRFCGPRAWPLGA